MWRFEAMLLLGAFALSGCGAEKAVNPVYVVQPLLAEAPVNAAAADGIPAPVYLEQYKLPGQDFVAVDVMEGSVAAPAGFDAASERDALKSALVARSDLICAYTEGEMLGNSDVANFGFGEAASVSGALGSVFTAAAPARILAGIAGVSSATQNQVSQQFFKGQMTTAIIQKIDSTRVAELAIINGHNGDAVSAYSLNDMIADVLAYHNACSFYEGVEGIVQSAERSAASDAQAPSGGGTSGVQNVASTGAAGNVSVSKAP